MGGPPPGVWGGGGGGGGREGRDGNRDNSGAHKRDCKASLRVDVDSCGDDDDGGDDALMWCLFGDDRDFRVIAKGWLMECKVGREGGWGGVGKMIDRARRGEGEGGGENR